MSIGQSLLGKYLTIALAIFLLMVSLTAASFFLTTHIQGEAQRVNLAGRQRMRIFHMAMHAHFLTAMDTGNETADIHLAELQTAIAEYEKVLHSLTEGCRACDLMPVAFMKDHHELYGRLQDLSQLWFTRQKPMLQQILSPAQRPAVAEEMTCAACHAAFVSTFDKVDDLASSLARHNERIITQFDRTRTSILLVCLLTMVGLVWFIRHKLLRPVQDLQAAALAMEKGEFPGPVLPRTTDEIGQLTATFNRMAATLATNFHKMEQEVEQRTAELRLSNEELKTFVYTVSHDLRAPLRAIQGFSTAIREDSDLLPPSIDSHVGNIAEVAEAMDTILSDLLRYSQIAFQEIRLEAIDTHRLVDHVLTELSAEIEKTAAQITVEASLPPVLGHYSTLHQVLINLLENGLKFQPPGNRPIIRVWGQRLENKARLLVSDNGIGIAPQDQHRIFTAFERLHGRETYGGSGIGLASVRRGIERLGGSCGVESAIGLGSTFWIELPLDPT